MWHLLHKHDYHPQRYVYWTYSASPLSRRKEILVNTMPQIWFKMYYIRTNLLYIYIQTKRFFTIGLPLLMLETLDQAGDHLLEKNMRELRMPPPNQLYVTLTT